MTITTLSSREFNQDTGRAKKAARSGPVFITDRGRPAHVLLTIEDYRRLTRSQTSIVELLSENTRLRRYPEAAEGSPAGAADSLR